MIYAKELFFQALKQKRIDLAKTLIHVIRLNPLEHHLAYSLSLELKNPELEETIFHLNDARINPNYILQGSPLLHRAIEYQNLHAIRYLVEAGGELNCLNSYSYFTLHMAAIYTPDNDLSCLQLLIERGIEIDALTPFEETALEIAVGLGKIRMVELLVKSGATMGSGIKKVNNLSSL